MEAEPKPINYARDGGINARELLYGAGGLLAGLLVLLAVWYYSGAGDTQGPTVTEVQPYQAPPFTLMDLDGRQVSLDQYRGKVVLLNFWATWCEPCKAETPALEAAYRKLEGEGFVILGVDLYNAERNQRRGLEDVRRFAQAYGVSYPVLLDEAGDVGGAYAIAPIPTSYMIDREGKVRYVKVGPLSAPDVEYLFRSLPSGS